MFQNRQKNDRSHSLMELKRMSSLFMDATSRPSLEIGFFTGTKNGWKPCANQLTIDFTTPENGLTRYKSEDPLKMKSSTDTMLKVPETHFLHHFVYNCKTSSFTSGNNSRISGSYSNSRELINKMSCECDSQSNIRSNNSKSLTEIIFKIPKQCQENSMDIKLLATALALQCDEECDRSNLCFESNENTSDLGTPRKNCNIPLGLKELGSNQNVQKYAIVASAGHDLDSCLCPEENQSEKSLKNKTDSNKVSIKLGENLFLSLVTDTEEEKDKGCEECNNPSENKDSGKFPAIKILVKCNGETIREITSPQPVEKKKTYVEEIDEKAYNQIFYVNTCKKAMEVDTDGCTSINCENKIKRNISSSLECCKTCCMAMNTKITENISSDMKSKCAWRIPDPEPDNNCTKCPMISRICSIPPKLENVPPKKPSFSAKKPSPPPQKKLSSPAKSQNRPTNKKSSNSGLQKKIKQPAQKPEIKPKTDKNINKSATSLRNSITKNCICTTQPKQKSNNCLCPPNKEDIVSLGSFSLFFIINDMKTGDCGCKKSESGELLQTAMICVHVDNSSSKVNRSTTSSCPAFEAFKRQYGNTPSICSCPSSVISKTSSCSCPSVRAGVGQTISSSVKPPSSYTCPFSKDEQRSKPSRTPVDQCTTSKRSSLHKNPCSQPSQIRFSVSIQAEKGKSCAAMVCPAQMSATTQYQPCPASKTKLEQTSVQVKPSNRSAGVQPSRSCGAPPQSVQACVSQKSASIQPSVCNTPTCSSAGGTPARQVLSNICPPSCKINLPKPCPAALPIQMMAGNRPTTCDMKAGPSFTCTAVKSLSCPSIKQSVCTSKPSLGRPSVICINESADTQSKSCSICINVSKLNDSRESSLKKVCSFSGECRQDTKAVTSKDSMKKLPSLLKSTSSSSMKKSKLTPKSSKTSCSICKELSKLGVCDEAAKPAPPYKGRPRVIPASPKLKKTRNFNQLSHLDVSGADNFIYVESKKGDLSLITEDYSDLKQAFEKFMVMENKKNSKCLYTKRG